MPKPVLPLSMTSFLPSNNGIPFCCTMVGRSSLRFSAMLRHIAADSPSAANADDEKISPFAALVAVDASALSLLTALSVVVAVVVEAVAATSGSSFVDCLLFVRRFGT